VGSKQSKQQERSDTEERKQGAPPQMPASKEVGTGKQHKDDEAHHEIK